MGQFFLSYSRADQEVALRFARDLKSAGADIWVDQVDIKPSDRWDRAVEAGLRESVGIVLIMSPRSVASENVADEISIALDAGKRVIPVLVEACAAPLRLARVQFIDATRDYADALSRCATAMNAVEGAAAQPAPRMRAPIPATLLENLKQRLTPYLGPIAGHLVEDESRVAESGRDLIARVAARVPSGDERARFLASVRDLGG